MMSYQFHITHTDLRMHTGSSGGQNIEQETDAINVGYTMGEMTIGLQDASTDNANFTKNAKDDTRTLGISVAF